MPLASFLKRNLGRFSHIYAKKHLVVEISVHLQIPQLSLCGRARRLKRTGLTGIAFAPTGVISRTAAERASIARRICSWLLAEEGILMSQVPRLVRVSC
jgi:hypothetical protein